MLLRLGRAWVWIPARVRGRGDGEEAYGVTWCETVTSADLGGSSKYSKENVED